MAFRRAGIPVMYTKGFNPLPKMEFASPLSVGISAESEIASVEFSEMFAAERFSASLNENLPSGIVIKQAESFLIKSGMKKHSLSSLLWGFQYKYYDEAAYVNMKEEKIYRQNKLKDRKSLFLLKRSAVLARNMPGDTDGWASYFDVYRFLYPDNK
jgi:radical SAM-linked protein